MDQNARNIRRLNLEAESAAEAPVVENEQPNQLSNVFFDFNTRDIDKSVLLVTEDEDTLYEWNQLMEDVNNWFNGLLTPHVLKQVPISKRDGSVVKEDVKQPYLNQIQNMEEVNGLYERALSLEMHRRNINKGAPFGTFLRLNNVVSLRETVLRNHRFCLSKFKQFLWKGVQMLPKVEKGDACFNHLNKSINQLISTGIFLRKYRSDLTTSELGLASDTAALNKIIDMSNVDECQDYLNCEMSVFVEPELHKAEMYLHELIRNQHKSEQALAEERKEQSQKAGRYLRSKNNKRLNNLSKRHT